MSVISIKEHNVRNHMNNSDIVGEVIHLPVAPQVTARTRFSSIVPEKLHFMMPHEAVSMLDSIMDNRGDSVSMVAISGPGDPFAVPDTTIQTIDLIRDKYPDINVGLKTLGIGGGRFAADFGAAGADYVEMQVDAIQAEILEKLYAWIRPGLKTLKISDAVGLLLQEQRNSVSALKYAGIGVGIVTTLYPGHNINHVKKISECMMELGADSISLIPYIPESGAEVKLSSPTSEMVKAAEDAARIFLPVTASLLSKAEIEKTGDQEPTVKIPLPKPSGSKKNVAVVSSNGIDVNLHLGQAENILIYGPREDGLVCLFESRKAPPRGNGSNRWKELAEILSDCFVLLTTSAGDSPREVLSEKGISIVMTDENIEGSVDVLYGGGKKGKSKKN